MKGHSYQRPFGSQDIQTWITWIWFSGRAIKPASVPAGKVPNATSGCRWRGLVFSEWLLQFPFSKCFGTLKIWNQQMRPDLNGWFLDQLPVTILFGWYPGNPPYVVSLQERPSLILQGSDLELLKKSLRGAFLWGFDKVEDGVIFFWFLPSLWKTWHLQLSNGFLVS